MKIAKVLLRGYKGVLNGLGLNELYIDFTKGKHKKIIIRGKNGTGKSEIFKALSMFPDPNEKLVPNMEAEKVISVIQDGTIYTGIIKHGVKGDGSRETTKAYLKRKTQFTEEEELNPNGNISSYKDLLFSELDLDPCYIALSELSATNRGLADMKPSERKKFIATILSSVEVYNNIYKTVSKRASIFKSMINSITSKIDNIGNEEQLRTTLSSLENRINELMNKKDSMIEGLGVHKSKVSLLDPNGTIQQLYNEIYQELIKLNQQYKECIVEFSITNQEVNEEIVREIFIQIKKSVDEMKKEQTIIETKIDNLLRERELQSKKLIDKNTKLDSYLMDNNYDSLKLSIEECNTLINESLIVINNMGIDPTHISKDEFILGLNVINDIKETIYTFRSYIEYGIIKKSIDFFKKDYYPSIEDVQSNIDNTKKQIEQLNLDFQKYSTLYEVSQKLSMRPSNCSIDSCQFIKDALQANNQNPEQKMDQIQTQLKFLNNKIESLEIDKKETISVVECINYLRTMIRSFNNNFNILNKLPVKNILSNKDELLNKIESGYEFKELDEIYRYIDRANIIDVYNVNISKLQKLQSDMTIFKNNNSAIKELESDIDSISDRIMSLSNELNILSDSLASINISITNEEQKILECEKTLVQLGNRKQILNRKSELVSKFEGIKQSITEIKECTNTICNLNNELTSISNQIKPLMSDRDKIKHGLELLLEYNEELKIYSLKYEKINIIKKFSSPSKGIQTLFMELYMNNTITLSNDLIKLLFDGKYALGQYIINESEFRIPCMGNSIPNDDISSMSSAQVCMISMVLSFVLLQQSSRTYNIIKLDEIDAALDTQNRIYFLQVLDQLMELLDVEQCIIISHNNEMDMTDCDIIQLRMADNVLDSNQNYIYKFA